MSQRQRARPPGISTSADLLLKEEVYPGVDLEFVHTSGTFTMGSEDGDRDERPVHEVEISPMWNIAAYGPWLPQ